MIIKRIYHINSWLYCTHPIHIDSYRLCLTKSWYNPKAKCLLEISIKTKKKIFFAFRLREIQINGRNNLGSNVKLRTTWQLRHNFCRSQKKKTNQINEWYYMGHEGVKRFLYLKLYQKHRRRRKISLKDIWYVQRNLK